MSARQYDAIVVGARCAGSPTAMLLARRGYDVLLVDRATFPSDTISTHLVHPPGVAALRRWGLLDRLLATGCPPIHTYVFDFGPFTLAGAPGTAEEPLAYAPRRTVLDEILVDAASKAGAEVRQEFTVDEILMEGARVVGIRGHGPGKLPVTERARVVVGADGLRSLVARAVNAEQYNEKAPLQGISDAFRDAELCATALDESFSGAHAFEDAMGRYQSTRDRHVLSMYEFTAELATLQPPPPELEQVLAAAQGNPEAMDGFARTAAGVISPAEYFSEANVARILGMAQASGKRAGGGLRA
jgi:2-polyprenyl-6-methoxyphenol hydroxylase-like FAD-dependent oxidoreductase